MAKIYQTITVPKKILETINRYLTVEPANESECLSENETIVYTADFGGGIEMDIKCCGVQYSEGDSNLAWAEAVLFRDGCELCHSEVSDVFDGVWELEYKDTVYQAEIVSA